jgi:amino acid adenylation domain-containing protein
VSATAAPRLLPELLLRAADSRPDGEAVRCSGSTLTYAETARAALALGGWLRDRGVERGDRIGVCLPKRVEMLPAVYGIMAAGAAYVPLDPGAPASRRALVARDCSIRALISTPRLAASLLDELDDAAPEVVITVPDGEDADPDPSWTDHAEATRGEPAPPAPLGEDDLAYILYTSGSTGVPKGVMLSHGNALAFVGWSASTIGTGPEDVFSNHAPLHFDLSVFDLYVAAWGAATLCPVPEEVAFLPGSLAAFVREQGISVWYSVPSALVRLVGALATPGELPSLRAVVFAGEVFPTARLRELRRLVPAAELWNLYGPTETNVVTAHHVSTLPADDVTIPIGGACSGASLSVLTQDGSAAAVGGTGELLVSGPTVMRGYWGDPGRTAEVLAADPITGATAYHTGDVVRVRQDGELDFIGRRDHQVKSRGYRIELGDIEAALLSHPVVSEVVAVAVPHESWGTEIAVFVVPREGETLSVVEVKRYLAARLPRYMVPGTVHVVHELDRTSTGKADRPALERRHLAGDHG